MVIIYDYYKWNLWNDLEAGQYRHFNRQKSHGDIELRREMNCSDESFWKCLRACRAFLWDGNYHLCPWVWGIFPILFVILNNFRAAHRNANIRRPTENDTMWGCEDNRDLVENQSCLFPFCSDKRLQVFKTFYPLLILIFVQSKGNIRDQDNCGSCWAVAVAGMLTDRLCILQTMLGLPIEPEPFEISAADILSCSGAGS